MNNSTYKIILTLLALAPMSACSVVGGIFKTGMGFGIFLTLFIVVGIIVLLLRAGRRKN